MKAKPWLWPDRAIGKRESRRLREEHNAAVNDVAALLEACRDAVATLANGKNPPSRRMEWASEELRAAIAQATGQDGDA